MKDLPMTQHQHSPYGHPQDPTTGGTPPDSTAAQKVAKKARPWHRKKRALIPTGILALAVVVGLAGCGGNESEPVTAASS